jgi:hypothetical protein
MQSTRKNRNTQFSITLVLALAAVPSFGCVGLDDELDTSSTEQGIMSWTLSSYATTPPGAPAIDLNVRGSFVYWTRGNDIFRVSKTPGSSTTTVCSGCGGAQFGLDASNVYYTNPTTDEVASVALGGGLPLLLTTSPASVGVFDNVVVDSADVYWVGGHSIYRVPTGGGSWTLVYAGSTSSEIADDASNIYMADSGTLYQIPKAAPHTPNSLVTAWTTKLRITGGVATWNEVNDIKQFPIAGGSVTTFNTAASSYSLASFAVDSTYIFFIEKSSSLATARIRRIPIATPTATPTTIVNMAYALNPGNLQTDGTFIYWADTSGIQKADRI